MSKRRAKGNKSDIKIVRQDYKKIYKPKKAVSVKTKAKNITTEPKITRVHSKLPKIVKPRIKINGKTQLQMEVDTEVQRLQSIAEKLEKRGFYIDKPAYSKAYSSRNLARLKAKTEQDIYKKTVWVDPTTGEILSRQEGEEILAQRATQADMTLDTLIDILNSVQDDEARNTFRRIMNDQIDEYGLTPYLESLDEHKKEIYDNLEKANQYKDFKRSHSYTHIFKLLMTRPMTAEDMYNMSQYDEDEAEDIDYE